VVLVDTVLQFIETLSPTKAENLLIS